MHQQARLAASSLSSMLSRAFAQKHATGPRDFGEQFLSLAWEEIKKYRKANLVAGASKLVHSALSFYWAIKYSIFTNLCYVPGTRFGDERCHQVRTAWHSFTAIQQTPRQIGNGLSN
jgi:hypothetical protein